MTIPFERTRAILHTKELLERLMDPKASPRVPRWVRGHARALLKHYPSLSDIELAHKALPHLYGPVPPFSRMSASPQTDAVMDASKAGESKEQ